MKNLKLLSALLVLSCASQVAATRNVSPTGVYTTSDGRTSRICVAASSAVASESSKSSAFATWADEKQAPVPKRKPASYDIIDKACQNLDARIKVKAFLTAKPEYWCRSGIDGLVDAYGQENHNRLEQLKNEPLSYWFKDTPYIKRRSEGVERRGIHSQSEFYNLLYHGSPVYNTLKNSKFTDKQAAERLWFLIQDSID